MWFSKEVIVLISFNSKKKKKLVSNDSYEKGQKKRRRKSLNKLKYIYKNLYIFKFSIYISILLSLISTFYPHPSQSLPSQNRMVYNQRIYYYRLLYSNTEIIDF